MYHSTLLTNWLFQGNMWRRKGWAAMDTLRERLEDLKELRDLVRSLGRGGGWGPLRRAPVQVLDLTKHNANNQDLLLIIAWAKRM